MVQEIMPGVHRMTISLPGNPLKSLNSYLIKGQGRSLLIDTGFNMPECLADLKDGLAQLDVDLDSTDVFLTHFHADHSGQVTQVANKNNTVYIPAGDMGLFEMATHGGKDAWEEFDNFYLREGYPAEELERTQEMSPARRFVARGQVPNLVVVDDGDIVEVGGISFTCVHTPGHTPGHMCLFQPDWGLLIAGDHILYDITPNITAWLELEDSLGTYLQSLQKVRSMPVKMALPAHREIGNFTQRIDELLAHHKDRLEDTAKILRQNPGLTGYQVASKMKWAIRAKDWSDFPPGQRIFAVGEALSHLQNLMVTGVIERREKDGVGHYYVI